ncbi:hypothetical protein [Arthrobacter sp. 35W]|uniref:hypothetical protein n=1 Tax=Arthrobacter sp. 35W TaxID=1132441 RepID=UPI00040C7562|nr:hypothetical protein [Arthrobacter sp. 35W]
MATASPDTLGTVAGQILQEAAEEASGAASQLGGILGEAAERAGGLAEQAAQLPADLLQRLEDFAKNPDWPTLLVFAFLRIRDLDREHLAVGALQVPGWSPAVALSYTTDSNQTLLLAVAIGVPGTRHGLHLRATGPLDVSLGSADALLINIGATAACAWDWEFGQSPGAPAESGALSAKAFWTLPVPRIGNDFVDFSLGPVALDAELSKEPGVPLYRVDLGLGDRSTPGRHGITVQARIEELLQGLGGIAALDLPTIDYSPGLSLQSGAAPRFSLGTA